MRGMRCTNWLCLACEFRVAINQQFDMTTACKFQYLQFFCLLSVPISCIWFVTLLLSVLSAGKWSFSAQANKHWRWSVLYYGMWVVLSTHVLQFYPDSRPSTSAATAWVSSESISFNLCILIFALSPFCSLALNFFRIHQLQSVHFNLGTISLFFFCFDLFSFSAAYFSVSIHSPPDARLCGVVSNRPRSMVCRKAIMTRSD